MGHERIGTLPRTRHWLAVVEQISGADVSAESTLVLADLTLRNVRRRFEGLADEDSTQSAIKFLLALTVASRDTHPNEMLEENCGIAVDGEPTPLALVKSLQISFRQYSNPEKSDLAVKALADALSKFYGGTRASQAHLFDSSAWQIWREADSSAGFCELARFYFSSLTERYLRYFLDREASAVLGDPQRVTDFRQHLHSTVELISRHAFETSKIAQSFAAGWFQKHAKPDMPTSLEIRGFLSIVLNKIGEELRREARGARSANPTLSFAMAHLWSKLLQSFSERQSR